MAEEIVYKFKNGSTIQCIPSKDVARPTNPNIKYEGVDFVDTSKIGLVEFVTDILDLKLLPHQKEVLYVIEKYPDHGPKMWFRRGDAQSDLFGWRYKRMWEIYCQTGEIKFPFYEYDDESFKKEYKCVWRNK